MEPHPLRVGPRVPRHFAVGNVVDSFGELNPNSSSALAVQVPIHPRVAQSVIFAECVERQLLLAQITLQQPYTRKRFGIHTEENKIPFGIGQAGGLS